MACNDAQITRIVIRWMSMKRQIRFLLLVMVAVVLSACSKSQEIISKVDEREANLIVVFLESKGISAEKHAAAVSGIGGGGPVMFSISVDAKQAVDAMAHLNQSGLPRRQGVDLLSLFAKQGFTTTDKEETIRYQAGLASQINNTILLIDGVLDASVQISFPPDSSSSLAQTSEGRVTAAVYVKHQGVVDDPNTHLENKIKRLVSGSVPGLDITDVTVVSDRSRFTDVSVGELNAEMGMGGREYVSIWSIVMSKQSATRFRIIFFIILILGILFAAAVGWILWKVYPLFKRAGGFKEILNPLPIGAGKGNDHVQNEKSRTEGQHNLEHESNSEERPPT